MLRYIPICLWHFLPPKCGDLEEIVFSSIRSLKPELHRKMSITVSKRLSKPHRIVAITMDYLKNQNLSPSYKRVITTGPHYLDVSISPDLLRRTMRIMDAIIKEGLKRGYEIYTGSYNSRSRSYFRIGKEKIYFRIYEIAQKRKLGFQNPKRPHWGYNYEIILTGNLRLMVCDAKWFYSVRCISDTKKAKIENQLDRFFKVVEELTEKSKKERLAREAHHRKMEEERRNRVIWQQKLRDEGNRREELEKHSEQFTKAQYIYQFIAEIDQQKARWSSMVLKPPCLKNGSYGQGNMPII